MGAEARFLKLEEKLTTLGFLDALKAADLMKKEMCAAKGFKRHDGSDYYHHVIEVTLLLLNSGIKDEVTLIGSLTHDYPEDVDGITIETLKHMFSQDVADTVKPLTKDDKVNYRVLDNLKAYYGLLLKDNVATPILGNWRSSLVKAADIMHNMSTLGDAKPEKKFRKIQEAEEVYIPFLREARNKFPRYASFFYIAKFSVEPIVRSLKKEEELFNRIEYLEAQIDIDNQNIEMF